MKLISQNFNACLAAVRFASETATLLPSPRKLHCRPWREYAAPRARYCVDASPLLKLKDMNLHAVAGILGGVHPCVSPAL